MRLHPLFVLLVVLGLLGVGFAQGLIQTAAGTGAAGFTGDGGLGKSATLNQPFHCDLDRAGNLFIAEAFNHCIRSVDGKTGIVTTVAGNGTKGYSGDGGAATNAQFNEPYAVVVDEGGNLFIVDRLNACVRRIDGKTRAVTTVAGTGAAGYSGDGGPGAQAQLREPNDCCLDRKGGLLIADVRDNRIRRLDLKSGVITTFAGTGARKREGDGGPAAQASLNGARAVCVDGKGNTYICEREGNAIRRVDARGIITAYAGTGTKGYTGDGGSALAATFNGPKAIRCDRDGNVFVVDTENHAIRRLEAKTGLVTTVAGGRKGGEGDGGDATQAGLDRPHGCVIGLDGTLYIADSNNHRVRVVRAS